MPSRWMWSPTVLPSVCAESASSTGRPCFSCARCRAMPSCRMWACSTRSLTSLTSDAEPCHRAGCSAAASVDHRAASEEDDEKYGEQTLEAGEKNDAEENVPC